MHTKPLSSILAISIALSLPAAALAQTEDADAQAAGDTPTVEDDFHDVGPAIVVIGRAGAQPDFLSGVDQLDKAELTQAIRPSLGETLAHSPGVSATSFGPSASRPILRGLQGERVRVLTDGIGAIDVSNTSVDHAVVVDPLLAERVEILRGPQSLLYGSAAIGGIVNVVSKRIPRRVPGEPIHVDALASYGSAASERSLAAAADIPLGDRVVVHADGSYLKTDDIRLGGFALSPERRREALATAALLGPPDPADPDAIDFAANAAIEGRLPNTASETWTAALSAAYVGDGGNFGLAYSHYDSLYGVPLRYATRPGQEQEAPRLALVQDRIDARAEIAIGGPRLDRINMRYGYADYRHSELEEDGAVGTTFYNQGMEGRIELVQALRGGWTGTTGAAFNLRDFDVVGDEAFLPANTTANVGLFSVQQLDLDRIKLEAGARFEHVTLTAQPTATQPQFFDGTRRFDTLSASLGTSYAVARDWRIGLNLSRGERAPAAEELFANGPHAGTQTYEIGDPGLKVEKSWGIEALLRGGTDDYHFELSAFHTWFSDFVYNVQTGAVIDGLPVFANTQGNARLYGFEAQASAIVARFGDSRVSLDGLVDLVRNPIDGVGTAPRIPPLRVLGGIAFNGPKFDLRGEVEWVDKQTRIADFETPTAGYTVTNIGANWRPWGRDRPVTLALSANNIFDVDARRHSSYLKDFAPLAGRDIRLSVRISL